ncbi:uncharacterized protein JCM6883_000610 [Sporobolomyces salmoneus]|uniref:uncharacterized protein n=1 Tax=Sporobolomyces salmoneus TaxID=183962 RepID=UPI00318259C1
MAPRGKGGRRGVWVPPSKPRNYHPGDLSDSDSETLVHPFSFTLARTEQLTLQQQLASTQKDLESTRKNLASNVTLLEEANLVMANQSQRITELETKVGEMEEERSRFEAGMNDEGPTLGNLWWKATKDKDKAEKELEELKKKCREFFTACGYEGVE